MKKIPDGWEVVRLGDIAEVNTGGNAPQGKKYFQNGEYPFIRVQHFNGSKVYVDKWDLINDKAVKDYKLKLFPKDAIVFPKSGASIKLEKRAILPFNSYLVNHLCVIISKSKIADNKYLFYAMKKISLSQDSAGTTLPYLNLEDILKLQIPLPPLPEQEKIAEILGTVDEAIEKVGQKIEKTERLKKGLMQKLLTEGIGHKEFKATEIGKIPKEWEVVRLGEIISYVKGKKPYMLSEEYKEGYFPYLSTEYLRNNGKPKFAVPNDNVVLIEDADLILLWDGSNAGEFFMGKKGILSSTMVKIQLKKDINTIFLFYLLKTKEKGLSSQTRGTGIPHVDKNVLEDIKIPLPPLSEQEKIAEILSTVDKKLELEKRRKEKLERIKKGLMDELLTGKKRVKVG